ncbi:hypothetical protein VB735_32630 [Halotia wernerae UHCC 0503]|nr:hypothetical protein [Halotia wernerae UHCC 0503]
MFTISPEEYNGFCIQIEQNPVEDPMTRERYWIFKVCPIGKNLGLVGQQVPSFMWNRKQYGGYEVALAEAKIYIDGINKNVV